MHVYILCDIMMNSKTNKKECIYKLIIVKNIMMNIFRKIT